MTETPEPGSRFNLSALAVREQSITLFFIIAIILAGTVAFLKLGRAEDPAFTIKIMTVVTAWPGATAQEMQDQVAEPLEKRLQELRWYDRSETFTRPGLAFTTLTLRDNAPPSEVQSEFYQARKKIADEAPRLPRGVAGPFVNDEYSDVTFALYALCVWPANFHHAFAHIAIGGETLGWWYHGPRLAAQPLIIWWALWAGGATDWPFRRR